MKKISNHQNRPATARPAPAGRPQAAAPSQPYFDSMESCQAITHVPIEFQKAAKKAGCQAFRSNRVYLYDFLEWFFATRNKDEDGAAIDWGKQLKKFQALREEIKFETDKGNVYPANAVNDGISTCLAVLFASLEKIFASEFPAACKGMDEIVIRTKALDAIEELRKEAYSKFDELSRNSELAD